MAPDVAELAAERGEHRHGEHQAGDDPAQGGAARVEVLGDDASDTVTMVISEPKPMTASITVSQEAAPVAAVDVGGSRW